MKRRLFLLIIAGAVAYGWLAGGDGPRRPLPAGDDRQLAAPSDTDPPYLLRRSAPCVGLCVGSAFAIDATGHWLTARHVIRGCRTVALVTADGRRAAVRDITHHPHADLSLLSAAVPTTALPVTAAPLRRGQDSFHFGYPQGEAGETHTLLLGRARLRERGVTGGVQPIIAWAEVSRHPPRAGSDGGISGGAVLDAGASVVGVRIGAVPRRGRAIAAAPEAVIELLMASGHAGRVATTTPDETLVTADDYGAFGARLRAAHSVVQVRCEA